MSWFIAYVVCALVTFVLSYVLLKLSNFHSELRNVKVIDIALIVALLSPILIVLGFGYLVYLVFHFKIRNGKKRR